MSERQPPTNRAAPPSPVRIADVSFFDQVMEAFRRDDPGVDQKQLESDRVHCVQLLYHAVARSAFEEMLDLTTDDFVLEVCGPAHLPMCGRWQGREEVLAALARNFSMVDEQRPTISSVVAQGDIVVVMAREQGIVRATGKRYDVRWVQEFRFTDGKVSRVYEVIDGGGDIDIPSVA